MGPRPLIFIAAHLGNISVSLFFTQWRIFTILLTNAFMSWSNHKTELRRRHDTRKLYKADKTTLLIDIGKGLCYVLLVIIISSS